MHLLILISPSSHAHLYVQVGGVKAGCFRIGNTGGMMDNVIACKLHRPGWCDLIGRSFNRCSYRIFFLYFEFGISPYAIMLLHFLTTTVLPMSRGLAE
jgi:hypothetical protein